MRARRLRLVLTATVLTLALSGSGSTRPVAQITMRIAALHGQLARLGTIDSNPLYGVRLNATLCISSTSAALATYPDEIRITHFAVRKSTNSWWPARTAIDRAPWLVPFGETWHGKACGPVSLEDAIPPNHYGVESLGNPYDCYGVGLTIKARGAQASRRAIVTCDRRRRFGG